MPVRSASIFVIKESSEEEKNRIKIQYFDSMVINIQKWSMSETRAVFRYLHAKGNASTKTHKEFVAFMVRVS